MVMDEEGRMYSLACPSLAWAVEAKGLLEAREPVRITS